MPKIYSDTLASRYDPFERWCFTPRVVDVLAVRRTLHKEISVSAVFAVVSRLYAVFGQLSACSMSQSIAFEGGKMVVVSGRRGDGIEIWEGGMGTRRSRGQEGGKLEDRAAAISGGRSRIAVR